MIRQDCGQSGAENSTSPVPNLEWWVVGGGGGWGVGGGEGGRRKRGLPGEKVRTQSVLGRV